MKNSALDFHNKLIKENGIENASGFSNHSRTVRFKVIQQCLEKIPDYPNIRLLDYGCYDGALFDTLQRKPSYLGVDINPKFVRYARKTWRDHIEGGRVQIVAGTLFEPRVENTVVNFAPHVTVASGVFCLRGEASNFVELIQGLYAVSANVFIFNALTDDVPEKIKPTKGIVRWKYSDILQVLAACQCRSWEIIRSYLPNDMTIVMRKKWTHALTHTS